MAPFLLFTPIYDYRLFNTFKVIVIIEEAYQKNTKEEPISSRNSTETKR